MSHDFNLWYFFSEKIKIIELQNSDFWKLLGPHYLIQFSKLNNFLFKVCSFLGKNLSNFVPPVGKLRNMYCHTAHRILHFWWPPQSLYNFQRFTEPSKGYRLHALFRSNISGSLWQASPACMPEEISWIFILARVKKPTCACWCSSS